MAGLGRKVFTRETLGSAELQGYLMDQAVMRFASVAARDAAIAAPTEGMHVYLDDQDATYHRVNNAWVRLADANQWVTVFEGPHDYLKAITTSALTPLPSMSGQVFVPSGRQLEIEAYIPYVEMSAGGALYLRIIVNAVGKVAAVRGAGANAGNGDPVEMKCTVDGTGTGVDVGFSVAGYAGGAGGSVRGPGDNTAPGPRLRYKIT